MDYVKEPRKRPVFPKRAVVTAGMPYGNKELHFGHIGGVFVGLLASRTVEEEKPNRMFYVLSAVYCLSEYSTELSSCFWMGDTIRNPYFWSDTVMSAVLLLLPIGLRKAVDR